MKRLAALLMAAMMAGQAAGQAAWAASSGASDPSIVIGFIATRSGGGAVAGQDAADGFALALKQLGGRFANQEVRVVALDDKGAPDVAIKLLERLVQTDRTDFVITAVGVSSLAAMRRTLDRSHLFVLNLETPPPGLIGADCSPDIFTLAPPPDAPHQLLGQYLIGDGVRKAVVISPDIPLADLQVAAFKRGFPLDVTVLKAKRGAATFARELSRIAAIHPDVVYSLLSGGMGSAFIRAYQEWDGEDAPPLYVQSESISRPYLAALGEDALDVQAVGEWSADIDNPGNKKLVADFEAEFGRPATTMAARGYDAALLLDSVVRANNGKTGDIDAVRTALRRADFPSVRGFFRFSRSHMPVLAYEMLTVARDARGRLGTETGAVVSKEWMDNGHGACPMHWPDEYVPPVVKATKKGG